MRDCNFKETRVLSNVPRKANQSSRRNLNEFDDSNLGHMYKIEVFVHMYEYTKNPLCIQRGFYIVNHESITISN